MADATIACRITRWRSSAYIDTLAAAYAETGVEQRAIESAHEDTWAIKDLERRRTFHQRQVARYQRRLAAYELHQPWRSNLH